MEEPQNETSGEGAGGDAGSSKGGAKLIRGGNGADGGPEPAGKGAEARAAETASAVTGALLHAGRRAAAGAQVARLQAEEVAADVGGDMLGELVGYAQRAYLRNARALSELLYCRTPFGLLRWQSNLLGETMSDLTDTNARILRLSSNKA